MDFSELIKNLQANGMTQAEIAEAVGSSQGYINNILHGNRGERIGFDLGSKLILLHKKKCRKQSPPTA